MSSLEFDKRAYSKFVQITRNKTIFVNFHNYSEKSFITDFIDRSVDSAYKIAFLILKSQHHVLADRQRENRVGVSESELHLNCALSDLFTLDQLVFLIASNCGELLNNVFRFEFVAEVGYDGVGVMRVIEIVFFNGADTEVFDQELY